MPVLERNKFLVPQELTMSQFLYIIRTKMKLRDSQVRTKKENADKKLHSDPRLGKIIEDAFNKNLIDTSSTA